MIDVNKTIYQKNKKLSPEAIRANMQYYDAMRIKALADSAKYYKSMSDCIDSLK